MPQHIMGLVTTIGGVVGVLIVGIFAFIKVCFIKVKQGKALVRTGMGKPKVAFSGMLVLPIIHVKEMMDISVKRVVIERMGTDGLICRDNLRADIKVAFFVGVNNTQEDVLKVAQSLGVAKGSEVQALVEFFDAKFSDALKTVGKRFDFVDLYNSRDQFKADILKEIGTDLNGYFLDDAAIDYLEQTDINNLNAMNILDAEGIKKITDLTAEQKVLANDIRNEEEKTITRQNVEAREAILEMERQLAETEEKQKREVETAKAREEAETKKVQEEERLKSERARIITEEELAIATENKDRQIIVAAKNKERTDAVETERVEKDRLLEVTERQRAVELADIEKDKAIEEEKKNFQHIVKERVIVEKTVVVEEEKIKDTKEWAEAERLKKVAVIDAEKKAEEKLITDVKAAEAEKQAMERKAAELLIQAQGEKEVMEQKAQEKIIAANAEKEASVQQSEAMKKLAEGKIAETAASGMAEVQVMEARANAVELEGKAEALVINEKGSAEASVMQKKFNAEAIGINEKAEAMKLFNEAGKEHEEFKLKLDKELQVEIAEIDMQKDLAMSQAAVLKEGLTQANIDIVGGETTFFEQIAGAITKGKSVDRMVNNSETLTDVKETFFNGDPAYFKEKLQNFVDQFAISSEDVKNLSLSALINRMMSQADDSKTKSTLSTILSGVEKLGLGNTKGGTWL